ncbi:D-sedoheptulose 7-phosphate isomerase [Campylobacter sputorum]|uniref:D-sedoheptulose 7-phosphate isomerase n=1 Tax=Campylobacter sputorum TaxID=206 RepID=UPI00053C06FE|nr:D-sedoheptulose 7-phosphate isomerase [Campylobacter sputorum]
MKKMIEYELNMHKEIIEKIINSMVDEIEEACKIAVETIKNGGKIILFGNGGSAGDAQHIAAELTGRYKCEREPLAAIALTTDTSAITAIGNDYGFDFIFLRQAKALVKKNDLLLGISTSGNSENVIKVLEYGKNNNIATLGLSGKNGGKMNNFCDLNIIVPSNDTARIQEIHILIGHIICQAIDNSK